MEIVNRCEAILASENPRHEILQRKLLGQFLHDMGSPMGYEMTPGEKVELAGYAMVALDVGALSDAARADAALVNAALDVEAAQNALRALPAAPAWADPYAAQRAALQAIVDGAAPEVTAHVAARAARFSELNPQPIQEPQP